MERSTPLSFTLKASLPGVAVYQLVFCGTSVIAEVDQESGRSHSYCATRRGVALHTGRRDRCRSAALQIKCRTGSYGAAAVTVASVGGGGEGISASSAREHSARVRMR